MAGHDSVAHSCSNTAPKAYTGGVWAIAAYRDCSQFHPSSWSIDCCTTTIITPCLQRWVVNWNCARNSVCCLLYLWIRSFCCWSGVVVRGLLVIIVAAAAGGRSTTKSNSCEQWRVIPRVNSRCPMPLVTALTDRKLRCMWCLHDVCCFGVFVVYILFCRRSLN